MPYALREYVRVAFLGKGKDTRMKIDLLRRESSKEYEEEHHSFEPGIHREDSAKKESLATMLGDFRLQLEGRVRHQADTARWDQFWDKHGNEDKLFDKILWPTRMVFSARHARLLMSHRQNHGWDDNGPMNVLEIGCGSATTSNFISKGAPNASMFGVDLSVEAIRVAKVRNPDLHSVVADAIALPFASEKFSLVFSSGVLEHFERAIADRMHSEHCRVAKSRGTVGLIVPWRHSPYNLLRILSGRRWPFGYENPFSIGELQSFTSSYSISDVNVHVSYGTTLTGVGRKQESTAYPNEDQIDLRAAHDFEYAERV